MVPVSRTPSALSNVATGAAIFAFDAAELEKLGPTVIDLSEIDDSSLGSPSIFRRLSRSGQAYRRWLELSRALRRKLNPWP
jgi:hypothetical protein